MAGRGGLPAVGGLPTLPGPHSGGGLSGRGHSSILSQGLESKGGWCRRKLPKLVAHRVKGCLAAAKGARRSFQSLVASFLHSAERSSPFLCPGPGDPPLRCSSPCMVTLQQGYRCLGRRKYHRPGNQRPDIPSYVTVGKTFNLSVPHFFICIMERIILILSTEGYCEESRK